MAVPLCDNVLVGRAPMSANLRIHQMAACLQFILQDAPWPMYELATIRAEVQVNTTASGRIYPLTCHMSPRRDTTRWTVSGLPTFPLTPLHDRLSDCTAVSGNCA